MANLICARSNRHYGTHGGWWPCEERALFSMVDDGYTYDEMAEVLDRSYQAVANKVKRHKKGNKGRK